VFWPSLFSEKHKLEMTAKLKSGIHVAEKNFLFYIVEDGKRLKRYKPWLGDVFSFLYDFLMKMFIFPKKLDADIQAHEEYLAQELKSVRMKRVLELATGSGSAVRFLSSDNHYTGTDISPGLLKQAARQFHKSGFFDPRFYVVGADDLPFENDSFDFCLCILSLNFFNDVDVVIREANRVLTPGGELICTVPVPERGRSDSGIRGVLHSEDELRRICGNHNFDFESLPFENGALLYFKAIKNSE
jgi:SAM-dependent methyltransferase